MKKNSPDITLSIKGDINTEKLMQLVNNHLQDDKIEEIIIFDLRGRSPITSYVVIGTGTSTKHISSTAEKLADKVEEFYNEPQNISMEGRNKNAQWILVDLDEVMVHLLTKDARENYNLEELYSQ